jgi:NADPH:quinone reductase-like Zn-dependent oxidoreductase
MKAISYDHFGDVGVLHATDAPMPVPGKGEITVAVRATSVNVIDSRVRAGMMGPLVSKHFPKIPGADFSGIISAIGPNVSGLKIGDAVFGAVNPFQGGAFAEYVHVPANQVALKPAGLSFEDAAALPIAGLAALQALRDVAHVMAGQRVLVHGASGGVGLFAVQLAKQFGATVMAVAGAKAADAVRKAGADVARNARSGGKRWPLRRDP